METQAARAIVFNSILECFKDDKTSMNKIVDKLISLGKVFENKETMTSIINDLDD